MPKIREEEIQETGSPRTKRLYPRIVVRIAAVAVMLGVLLAIANVVYYLNNDLLEEDTLINLHEARTGIDAASAMVCPAHQDELNRKYRVRIATEYYRRAEKAWADHDRVVPMFRAARLSETRNWARHAVDWVINTDCTRARP